MLNSSPPPDENASCWLLASQGHHFLRVMDPDRADEFYGQTLGLQPAFEGGEQVGYFLGDITLMLKENWYASPTQEPNPRVTMETDDALQTERELSERGVTISDPVKVYDEFYVGGLSGQ